MLDATRTDALLSQSETAKINCVRLPRYGRLPPGACEMKNARSLRSVPALLHRQQFDVKNQRGVGRDDAAGAVGAIAKRGRDDQSAFAADLHRRHAFVP